MDNLLLKFLEERSLSALMIGDGFEPGGQVFAEMTFHDRAIGLSAD